MIINILLLMLVIGLFILFIKNTSRYLQKFKLNWLLGTYLAILLASLAILYMLPGERFMEANLVSREVIEEAQKSEMDFHHNMVEGNPEQAEGIYKLGEWELEFEGNELIIEGKDYVYNSPMIVVDRKDTEDGRIEAFYFTTKTILERMDVTQKLKTPELLLEGSRLIIGEPEIFILETARFDRDFVLTQLEHYEDKTEIRQGYQPHSGFNVFGRRAIYLRVPENVTVDEYAKSHLYIIFTEKE